MSEINHSHRFGSLWMLVAALGFACMGALVKLGSSKFSSAELVFYRSLFGFGVIFITAITHQLPLTTPYPGKQLSRGLIGFVALLMFFYAIGHLHLATAITLNYTSPLFLAAFMPFMLHERPKPALYTAIIIGFLGVVLLLKPTIQAQDLLPGLVGVCSGLGAGIAYLIVKQLGNSGEPDWRTVFYFTLISCVGSGIWMLLGNATALTWQDMPILLGIGISATLAQLALTRAYRTGQTLLVASLSYTTVVISSLFGIWFWGEQLSLSEWVAIALIVASGITGIYTTQAVKKQSRINQA